METKPITTAVRNVSGLSPEAVAKIDSMLAAIRTERGVRIPLAVESGSRAWGFPSPDSDYDCRFVFVRPLGQYLTLWPRRDVIEMPPVADLDVNGWDLGKALRLVVKGNAVVVEWLHSPIVYTAEPWFRRELLDFAHRFADRARIQSHYLHLGARQRAAYFRDDAPVALKKLFYVLRPAAALRWLRLNPAAALPPMHFPTLMEEGDWPAEIATLTRDMLARKAATRELGRGPVPKPLLAFAAAELDRAPADIAASPPRRDDEARAESDRLFREIVKRLDQEPPPTAF
jgi:predicted nucleotidyltransferase